MIDGVELSVLEQAHQVRKFERDRSAGLESRIEPSSKVVDIGYVGIDVVARDEVGLPARRGQPPAKVLAEKLADDRNTELLGSDGGARRRLNT